MSEPQLKLLYSEDQIRRRVRAMSRLIKDQYETNEQIVCLCVLRGAVMFFTDLVKELEELNIVFEFIALSSYGEEQKSSGSVKLINDITVNVENKHVLVVEDIIDSGLTVDFIRRHLEKLKARSVKVACLIDKPCRKTDAYADYTAFTVEGGKFIVGYGLDYQQRYRQLNGIYEVCCD